MSLDYTFEGVVYNEYESQNDERHNAKGALNLTVIRKLFYIDLADTYSLVAIDTDKSTVEEEVDVNMVQKNIFSVTPYLKRDITAKTTFKGGYTFTNTDYDGSLAEDINYNIAFASF